LKLGIKNLKKSLKIESHLIKYYFENLIVKYGESESLLIF